jgi:hypothetical protein
MARTLAMPAGCTARTSCRTPTATACSPAGWAPTTAPRHRRDRHPHVRRQHRRQIMIMQDFRRRRCSAARPPSPLPGREADEMGVDLRELRAARGHLRRRALDRGDARGDRGRAGHPGAGHLRPERDHRPGRGLRVRMSQRACTSSRTTSTRDHRPQTGEPCPTGRRASWCSPR